MEGRNRGRVQAEEAVVAVEHWSPERRYEHWLRRPWAEEYLTYNAEKSGALERLLPPGLSKDASILEVGCNCGRNLSFLEDLGYTDLTGVDLNPSALAYVSEETHASTFEANLETREGWAIIPGRFDLVFTMAVLIHLFPDWVLDEVAAKASRWLVTIEDEKYNAWRQVARDYEKEFTARGFRVLRTETYGVSPFGPGYVGRLYERVVCDS